MYRIMNSYYVESINKAVDYIKNNLDKKINLREVSEAADISRFHFHRIFEAYTEESVFDTVIRLRIERAAVLLLDNTKTTISELAKTSGFKNQATFSIAFKERYSISPSVWRKEKSRKNIQAEAERGHSLIKSEEDSLNWVKPLSTDIKKLEGFSIAYIRHTGAYAGDSALFIYLYNKLTTWAASEGLLSPERHNIVVYHDPVKITEDSRKKISLGISVPEETKTAVDIGKMKLQGGDYFISRYSLRDEEYNEAWNRLYRYSLPENNLQPADGFCFELYPTDVKSNEKYSSVVDICVPVNRL